MIALVIALAGLGGVVVLYRRLQALATVALSLTPQNNAMTFADLQAQITKLGESATAAEQRSTAAVNALSIQIADLQTRMSNSPSSADVDAAVTTLGQIQAGLDALNPIPSATTPAAPPAAPAAPAAPAPDASTPAAPAAA